MQANTPDATALRNQAVEFIAILALAELAKLQHDPDKWLSDMEASIGTAAAASHFQPGGDMDSELFKHGVTVHIEMLFRTARAQAGLPPRQVGDTR